MFINSDIAEEKRNIEEAFDPGKATKPPGIANGDCALDYLFFFNSRDRN